MATQHTAQFSDRFNLLSQSPTNNDTAIEEMARRVAQSAGTAWEELGWRSRPRISFPELVALSPLKDDGKSTAGATIYVVGRNLATLGFDFYHQESIPHRFAIVSLPIGSQQYIHIQMKITWCRFRQPRWYDSGGRFVKVVESPKDSSSNFPLHCENFN